MPQTYIEKREKARQMYVESGGKTLIKQIAATLDVPRPTVSGWKKTDKWDKQLKRKPKSHRGGSKGNKNASKPMPSMKDNQNNLKHGRYQQIKYETLTDKERQLMDEVADLYADQLAAQIQIIKELELREMRMLERIKAIEQEMERENGMVLDYHQTYQKGVTQQDVQTGKQKPLDITRGRKRGLDKIQEIETALTAVQKQKQAALVVLHKLTEDKLTRQIEQQKIQMEERRVSLMERRLNLIDPASESDAMKEARELLGGIESAF